MGSYCLGFPRQLLAWTKWPKWSTHLAGSGCSLLTRSSPGAVDLHVPSPCGLSFSKPAGHFLRGHSPRGQSRSHQTTLHLVSEVTQHHLGLTVLITANHSKHCRLKGREIKPTSWREEYYRICRHL